MNLTITEIKEINNAILTKFGINFSDYSLISYKNRLLSLMESNNYKKSKNLISDIENNKLSLDSFLFNISVPFTEMFRDPAMWRELRDDILPLIKGKIRIFIPSCTSGEELISLIILLKEEGYLDRAKITVSSYSKQLINNIKELSFSLKQMELYNANYKRYKGKANIDSFGKISNNKIYFDDLINNVNFIESLIIDNKQLPTGQDIVLYRNKIIYFNLKLQNKIINIISETNRIGGYLILGTMENLFISDGMKDKYSLVSETEKIFKKIV